MEAVTYVAKKRSLLGEALIKKKYADSINEAFKIAHYFLSRGVDLERKE
jgi:hypothetical protein